MNCTIIKGKVKKNIVFIIMLLFQCQEPTKVNDNNEIDFEKLVGTWQSINNSGDVPRVDEIIFSNNSNFIKENFYSVLQCVSNSDEVYNCFWQKDEYIGNILNNGKIEINATEHIRRRYLNTNNNRGDLDTLYYPDREYPHTWFQSYKIFGDSVIGIQYSGVEWQYFRRSYIDGWEMLYIALK